MEAFSALLAFVQGIHRSPVNSPHKDQWRGALMSSLNCAWTNNWTNNGNAGELGRHRVHCDVIVMLRFTDAWVSSVICGTDYKNDNFVWQIVVCVIMLHHECILHFHSALARGVLWMENGNGTPSLYVQNWIVHNMQEIEISFNPN